MSAYMLVTGAVFHRIENGLVYWEVASGEDRYPKAMPISEFRAILREGQKIIDEFDLDHRVLAMPRR